MSKKNTKNIYSLHNILTLSKKVQLQDDQHTNTFLALSMDQSSREMFDLLLLRGRASASFPNGRGGAASVIWKSLRRASWAASSTAVSTVSP